MNNEEAKFILRAYRPNGADAADPLFSAPCTVAERDPQLGAWFARELAFDAAIAAKLRGIDPPAELRDIIVAGGRASLQHRLNWRVPLWLSAAAAIFAFFFTEMRIRPATSADVQQLTSFALGDAAHPELHKGYVATLADVEKQLEEPKTRLSQDLNINDGDLRDGGCRTIQVAGHDVFEICINRGDLMHLYIARREDFEAQRGRSEPTFRVQGKLASATWTDDRHAYVLVSDQGVDDLRRAL
jgi:hypothetical protein